MTGKGPPVSAPTLEDFIGDFRVRQGSVAETGAAADDPRRLVYPGRSITLVAGGGAGTLDFTLLDEGGEPVLGPLPCRYLPDTAVLYHRDDDYEGKGQPLTLQISLYRDDASAYKAAYGLMIYGDPDNVGVWGADESG